jgi:hypothetical protein
MAEFPQDPDSLADNLDDVLPPSASLPPAYSDDPFVQVAAHLAGSPKPEMSSETMAKIRTQVIATYRQQIKLEGSRRRFIRFPRWSIMIASLLLMMMIGVQLAQRSKPAVQNSITSTEDTPSFQTLTPIATRDVPSAVPVLPLETPTMPLQNTVAPDSDGSGVSELPVTLVIEGPVQVINGSTITIYDIRIQLDATHPLLSILQVGDVVRIEGELLLNTRSQTISATSISLVDTAVTANSTGEVWRDDGTCDNPPPAWAQAHGWRRRCEGQTPPGQDNKSDKDNEKGMGKGQ